MSPFDIKEGDWPALWGWMNHHHITAPCLAFRNHLSGYKTLREALLALPTQNDITEVDSIAARNWLSSRVGWHTWTPALFTNEEIDDLLAHLRRRFG